MQIELIFDEGSSKEDSFLIKDNIFGVFDGADGLEKFVATDGRTGGLIASQIARDEFYKNDFELKQIALNANKKILEKMIEAKIDINKKSIMWLTTVAVVRIKEKFFEWAQISDSLILVVYKDNSFKLLVEDYDHDKEILLLWKKFAKKKITNIRKLVEKELVNVRNNIGKNWGVINGTNEIEKFLKTGKESLENVKHIIIFSDGLILPKKDPAKADDFEKIVELYLKGGLQKVKNFIRDIQKTDQECWKY
ncbi:MAG: hypothetical protein Q7K42_02410, partial [Candidatus Diapherotrites archaeon]|nr:hypothetical protein [Candidatus Diapherotrites archaeon]